jgi:molybdopterin-guanine dinucleotide biosynthesis protein A
MKIDIPCVILAGGKSSRMGEDKCFLPFKNTTLIKYQYDRLSKIFTNVYISSKINKFDFDCNLIIEDNDVYSPMIALNTIVNHFDNKFFIIPVDTPNITKETINKVIQNYSEFDDEIVVIQTLDKKIHNLCGIFSISIKEKIKEILKSNNYRIKDLIRNCNSRIIYIKNHNELININTKKDYYSSIKYYRF